MRLTRSFFLDKLYRNFGVHGKPLDILTSYLKNRFQDTNVPKSTF